MHAFLKCGKLCRSTSACSKFPPSARHSSEASEPLPPRFPSNPTSPGWEPSDLLSPLPQAAVYYWGWFQWGWHTAASVAIGPAPHSVSRALRARNPGKVRKESGKSTPRARAPKVPLSAPWSVKRVRKESQSQVLDSFRTLLRLRGALFRDFGGPGPGLLFPDSSGVSGTKGPGDAVWGGANRKASVCLLRKKQGKEDWGGTQCSNVTSCA